jgi:uncharacterized protein (TIGR03083 family)
VLSAELLYGELDAATAGLAALVDREDADLPIPTCPGWTIRHLTTHVGRAHRWAAVIVGTRSARFIEFRSVPDGKSPPSAAERARWLTDGAARLIDAVRNAGDDRVWAFGTIRPAAFWARRMAHETLVHCADARIAAGEAVDIQAGQAADAIDEWLTVMSGLNAGGHDLASIVPAGTSLHVRATGPGPGAPGEWLVRHSASDEVEVLSGRGGGDTTLAGPAADVLLVLMRRLSLADGAVEVTGDAGLLDRWLKLTAF